MDLDRTVRLLRSARSRGAAHRSRSRGGEPLAHGALGEADLLLGVGERQQRARLAGGELPLAQQLPHLLRQAQQAERVGDGGAGLADAGGDLLLGQAELLLQGGVGLGLFQRVQVAALEVLDQGQLEQLAVVGHLRARPRGPLQARPAGGAPAALAGDDRVALPLRASPPAAG